MLFDFNYITPKQAAEMDLLRTGEGEEYYQKLADKDGACENCTNPRWKLADNGLCFSCTTGETDASDDYEIL